MRDSDFARIGRADLEIRSERCRRLLGLGLPMGAQNVITGLGGVAVQSVINGFGTIFVAGFTAANKIYGLLETAAVSYSYAMVSYTGQNAGAGDYERVRKGFGAACGLRLSADEENRADRRILGRNLRMASGRCVSGTVPVVGIPATDYDAGGKIIEALYMLYPYHSDALQPQRVLCGDRAVRGIKALYPLLLGKQGYLYTGSRSGHGERGCAGYLHGCYIYGQLYG